MFVSFLHSKLSSLRELLAYDHSQSCSVHLNFQYFLLVLPAAVDRFPVLERDRDQNTNSIERTRGQSSASVNMPKLQDHNHNREVVFALPSLRLHFKTEHLQSVTTPESTADNRPVVECSFITEFEDHIFVTVDADAFFFLHDLITSYLKEKEKVVCTYNFNGSSSLIAEYLII